MIRADGEFFQTTTAILFIVFNRPITTKRVFNEIRLAKPSKLYIASDGPRDDRLGEVENVALVRDIVSEVDWACEVKTLYREKNKGCKESVSSAITWFFQNEEQGIILEDDCLPNQSFFRFCDQLLNIYKNDMRIWHIGGMSTLSEDVIKNEDSYYFSRYSHIWGWATWASRWQKYNVDIPNFPLFKEEDCIGGAIKTKIERNFWLSNFKAVFEKKVDTWDYQWYFAIWANHGLSILPTKNLVSNIGFGPGATHTTEANNRLANVKKFETSSNLVHPKFIVPNVAYDNFDAKFLYKLSYIKYFIKITKVCLNNLYKFCCSR